MGKEDKGVVNLIEPRRMLAAATLWNAVFAPGIVLCLGGRPWLQAAAERALGLQSAHHFNHAGTTSFTSISTAAAC